MKNVFTAIFEKEHEWWIGWVEEVSDANPQEKPRDGLPAKVVRGILELHRRGNGNSLKT